MQIREPDDAESAQIGRELLLPFFREEESLDPEFNRLDVGDDPDADHWLDHPERGLFVATIDGELVGVITLGRSASPPIYERGAVAHLEGLYVKPEFRRQGIGTALLERAEAWASANQCDHLKTLVHADNEAADSLYRTAFSLKYRSYWRSMDG